MNFVAVKEVPKKLGRGAKYSLKHRWEEFMKMNAKVVKVDLSEGDYSCLKVAYTTIYASIKRYGYPIDVKVRDGAIYLIRRDM